MNAEEITFERRQTGIRILFSLLFFVIFRVVSIVLSVVVVFELLFALITERPPSERVRLFANRCVSYLYRITRYLSYNQVDPPFPFSDLPPEVEPSPSIESFQDRDRGTSAASE